MGAIWAGRMLGYTLTAGMATVVTGFCIQSYVYGRLRDGA
jgi:hypothetical protein